MWIKRFEKPMQTLQKLNQTYLVHFLSRDKKRTKETRSAFFSSEKKARKEKILYIILIMN